MADAMAMYEPLEWRDGLYLTTTDRARLDVGGLGKPLPGIRAWV